MLKPSILISVLVLLLVPSAVLAGANRLLDGQQSRELAAVRQATAKYQDVNVAIADGYVPTDHCIEGMGYHYFNPELASDLTSDPLRPELLIYAPSGNGVKLVAVEWFQADVGQERPTVLGQPFDGPMDGHEPGMPVHYDLHAWIWQANPDGTFTPWNPMIHCH